MAKIFRFFFLILPGVEQLKLLVLVILVNAKLCPTDTMIQYLAHLYV